MDLDYYSDSGPFDAMLENKTLEELLASLNFSSVGDFLREYNVELTPIASDLSLVADVFLIVSYSVIFLLSLVGNVLVVVAVARHRSMRTVINAFIVSLAISDLLITIFCMPFTLVETITVDWPWGPVMCHLLNYVTMVAVVSSVLTLAAIAVERHQAVCRPLRARVLQTPRRAAALLAGLWVASVVLVSPLLFVLEVRVEVDAMSGVEYRFCLEAWPTRGQRRTFTLGLVLCLYVLPVLTMAALYVRVAHRLWIRRVVSPAEPSGLRLARAPVDAPASLRNKRRATKMLIVVVALFALSWLPFHVVSLVRDFTRLRDSEANRLLLAVVQLVGFSNSFNNPVVYAFLNENFKRTFRKALCASAARRRPAVAAPRPKPRRPTATHAVSPYAIQTTL